MKLKLNVGIKLFAIALALVIVYVFFHSLAIPGSAALAFAAVTKADTEEEEPDEDEEDADTKTLLKKVRAAARKEVETHVKAFNEDGEAKIQKIVDKKMEIFKDVPVDKLKAAVENYEAANTAIAELKARGSAPEGEKENLLRKRLKEVFPDIKKRFEGGAKSFRFQVAETKAAGEDQIDSAAFGDRVIFGFREAGVSFEALPELFILDLIQVMAGGPGSNPLSWIERNVFTQSGPPVVSGNPATVAELASKPQIGYKWVENKVSAETIAAIVPVTKQAIFNYTMLDQEVRFELMRRLASILQGQIINGDGSSPNMKGINAYAQAFSAGTFAGAVLNANEFDVLVAGATQILNSNYVPSAALVSHNSKGKMSLAKGSNGQYVMPPFSTADGLNVYGLKVIGTTEMPTDQFLIMDPTKSLFNWVENIVIEVGMIDDDFEKNLYRLRGELQGMHRIKEHEKLAFVKGDFSDAIGTITI